MITKTWYVIIGVDLEARLVSRSPKLRVGEQAVRLDLRFPQPPALVGQVTIDMPAAPATLSYTGVEPAPEGPVAPS